MNKKKKRENKHKCSQYNAKNWEEKKKNGVVKQDNYTGENEIKEVILIRSVLALNSSDVAGRQLKPLLADFHQVHSARRHLGNTSTVVRSITKASTFNNH